MRNFAGLSGDPIRHVFGAVEWHQKEGAKLN